MFQHFETTLRWKSREKVAAKVKQKGKKDRHEGGGAVGSNPISQPIIHKQKPILMASWHKWFLNWSLLKGFKNTYPIPILTFFPIPSAQIPVPVP